MTKIAVEKWDDSKKV